MDNGEENGSKISLMEWGLVIGALFVCDLLQAGLDLLVIGEFTNPFFDLIIGMSFGLYLQMRGESLTKPSRAFGLLGTFLLEMVPLIDDLPLWSLDGLFNMLVSRPDILNKVSMGIPGSGVVNKLIIPAKTEPNKPAQEKAERLRELPAKNTNPGFNSKENAVAARERLNNVTDKYNLDTDKNKEPINVNEQNLKVAKDKNQTVDEQNWEAARRKNRQKTVEEENLEAARNKNSGEVYNLKGDEAIRLRNERLEVARRLGLHSSGTSQETSDLEKAA